MKRLLILLCALMLTGCASKESGKVSGTPTDLIEYPANTVTDRTSPSDLDVYDPWGILMAAENPTGTGCTLICIQLGGEDVGTLETGTKFSIEVKNGNGWSTYPTLEEDVAWTDEAWEIERDSAVEWTILWDDIYGQLPAGQYRIVKDVMNYRGPDDYDQKTYYAEFTVE